MSMITEQVEYLIKLSNKQPFDSSIPTLQRACKEAANTIEQLAAKVQAANMEQSTAYYNGGWIPVSEGLPEDGRIVLFCDIDGDIMVGYHIKGRPATHFSQCGTYDDMKNVKAWMPLPEPYREDGDTE